MEKGPSRLPHKQKNAGSNPAPATKCIGVRVVSQRASKTLGLGSIPSTCATRSSMICTSCNQSKPEESFWERSGRGTRYLKCKSCMRGLSKTSKFSSSFWVERFSAEELALFSKLKNLVTKARGRSKEVDPDLSWEDLYDLWLSQQGLCKYSGVPLSVEANHPHTVSLDRVDSSKGYFPENLQLVSASVNRMKQEFKEDFFLDLCLKITNNTLKTTQK